MLRAACLCHGAAARVENYEIPAYSTAIMLAEQIDQHEVVKTLNESLAEEQAGEKKLRTLAKAIVKSAPAEQEKKTRASICHYLTTRNSRLFSILKTISFRAFSPRSEFQFKKFYFRSHLPAVSAILYAVSRVAA